MILLFFYPREKRIIRLAAQLMFSDLRNVNDVLLEKPLSITFRTLGFLNHLTLCNLSLLFTITHSSSSTSLFLTRNRVTWIYYAYIFDHRSLNIFILIKVCWKYWSDNIESDKCVCIFFPIHIIEKYIHPHMALMCQHSMHKIWMIILQLIDECFSDFIIARYCQIAYHNYPVNQKSIAHQSVSFPGKIVYCHNTAQQNNTRQI